MQDLQSRGRRNERISYSILSRVFNPSQETIEFLSSFDNEGVTTNRLCVINYKKQLTWELQAGMAEYGNKISVFLFIKKIPQG